MLLRSHLKRRNGRLARPLRSDFTGSTKTLRGARLFSVLVAIVVNSAKERERADCVDFCCVLHAIWRDGPGEV